MTKDFEQVMQNRVKAVTRRHFRTGINAGLQIREIKTQLDFIQYESIYQAWATAKGIEPKPFILIENWQLKWDLQRFYLEPF